MARPRAGISRGFENMQGLHTSGHILHNHYKRIVVLYPNHVFMLIICKLKERIRISKLPLVGLNWLSSPV